MISKRAESITPFIGHGGTGEGARDGTKGVDIIHLEVGEPDFDINRRKSGDKIGS